MLVKNRLLALIVLIVLTQPLFAQDQRQQHVVGIVLENIDGKDQPVIGANVYYPTNPQKGTVTDVNGLFEIDELSSDRQLVISYIGFTNDTISITGDTLELVLSKSVELNTIEIVARQKTSSISYMKSLQVTNIGEKELLKAACCNLSESFETSPSVDVSFTDAVTGTRTIQMLGLSGPYIQMTSGNMPDIRGLTSIYGLTFVPGTWIENIQLIKGTGTVINGYESITGQINTETRNSDDKYKTYVNLYGNQGTRMEGNLVHKIKLNDKWGMTALTHAKTMYQTVDNNDDGFIDMPLTKQAIGQTNFRYKNAAKGLQSRISLKAGYIKKEGGQLLKDIPNPYLFGVDGTNVQITAKVGKVNKLNPNRSTGLQLSTNYYNQKSYFGSTTYDAKQANFYGNLINQRELKTTKHILKLGASMLYDNYDELLNGISFQRSEIVPGVFAEYTFDPNDRFTAVIGGRADYHNEFGAFFTPRLHWRYELKEGTVLRGTTGRGQRTSNVFSENIGLLATSRNIRFKTDSTQYAYGLSPEVAWNYGLSLTHNFTMFYRDGVASVDFYRTDFQNQIILDLDENPQEVWFYNLEGNSYSNSFQVQVDYELIRRLDIRMAYRWFDVVSTYAGKERLKPLMSAHRGFINLGYETKGAINLDLTAQVQGKKRVPSTGTNLLLHQREVV